MPKEYEPSFKKEVIRRYEQGVSLNALGQEFHVALSTLYHWRKEYCSISLSGTPMQKRSEYAQIAADGIMRQPALPHGNDHPVKV